MLKGIPVAVTRYASLAGGALLLGSTGAAATEPSPRNASPTAAETTAPDPTPASRLDLEPVDLSTLAEQRGRQGLTYTQLGKVDARIDLRDNQVHGSVSGDNVIGSDVFEGARGIATVIQNSGHNVAIQESLVINIAIGQ